MTEYEAFLRAEAARRGIDPDVAVRVANTEGSLTEPARRGTFSTGSSWWAFQLHYGGPSYEHLGGTAGMGNGFTARTGWAPGDPAAWKDAMRYSLDEARRGGWGPWYGARNVGITGFDGINRSTPWTGTPDVEWDYRASPPGPTYDSEYPSFSQNDSFSCAPTSLRWAMHAFGRRPTEAWIEGAMLAQGVVSQSQGLLDASGAGLADFVRREYAEFDYSAWSMASASFDDVKLKAGTSPVLLGGRRWGPGGHWSGVRGYDAGRDVLLLANPANNYGGQTMTRQQFDAVAPASMVVVTHTSAAPVPIPTPTDPRDAEIAQLRLELADKDRRLREVVSMLGVARGDRADALQREVDALRALVPSS